MAGQVVEAGREDPGGALGIIATDQAEQRLA